MKAQAIIPAAGSGVRLKADKLKPFIEINGRSILALALEVFEASALIDSVIVVVPPQHMAEFESLIHTYGLDKVSRIVAGGKTRRESVYNGLQLIDHDTDIVVVHDAARPLIDKEMLEKAIKLCEKKQAVVIGVPIKPTIKRVDKDTMQVKETIDRQDLWEVQTPQVFKKELLLKAHKHEPQQDASDDALLLERIGVSVTMLEGTYKNIKITTPEDLTLAEAFFHEGRG